MQLPSDTFIVKLAKCLDDSEIFFAAAVNLEGKYIYVNEAFRIKFSENEEVIGKLYIDSISYGDQVSCLRTVEKSIENPYKPFRIDLKKPKPGSKDECFSNTWEFTYIPDAELIIAIGYDISKEIETSNLYKDALDQVNSLLASVTDGYFVITDKFQILHYNSIASATLGNNKESLKEKSLWDFWPDDRATLLPKIAQAFNTQIALQFEYQCLDNGNWFHFSLYPSNIGLTILFRDITKDIGFRTKLIDSENKLRYFIDSTSDINVLIGTDYKILLMNNIAKQAISAFFGKEPHIGDDFREYVIEDSEGKKLFFKAFDDGLKGKSTTVEYEAPSDEGGHWFLYRYFPVYDASGGLYGVAMNTIDIHERKRTQQKIAESEQLLSAIYDSVEASTTYLNADGTIKYFNKACLDLLHKESKKVPEIGKSFLEFMHPDLREEHHSFFLKALKGSSSVKEIQHKGKWYSFQYYPVYDHDRNIIGVVQILSDITEKVLSAYTIQDQKEKLDTIAWLQSHEIRGPLSNVLGLIELMEEDAEKDLEKQLELLKSAATDLDTAIKKIVDNSIKPTS
jgi:PAS domain S-box-containing protein